MEIGIRICQSQDLWFKPQALNLEVKFVSFECTRGSFRSRLGYHAVAGAGREGSERGTASQSMFLPIIDDERPGLSSGLSSPEPLYRRLSVSEMRTLEMQRVQLSIPRQEVSFADKHIGGNEKRKRYYSMLLGTMKKCLSFLKGCVKTLLFDIRVKERILYFAKSQTNEQTSF